MNACTHLQNVSGCIMHGIIVTIFIINSLLSNICYSLLVVHKVKQSSIWKIVVNNVIIVICILFREYT